MSELKHFAAFFISGWFLMEGLAAFQSGDAELGAAESLNPRSGI